MGQKKTKDDISDFHNRDPVVRILHQRLHLSFQHIVGLNIVVNIIVLYVVGSLVSYVINKDAHIIRTFDSEYIYFSLFSTFIFVPVVWILYLWQPKIVLVTMSSLRRNNVVVETEENSLSEFIETIKKGIDYPLLPILAFFLVLLWEFIETIWVLPNEQQALGITYFWFYNKWYYYLLYTPLELLNFYVVAMILLKALLILSSFNALFNKFCVRVHPLHPDAAGGLGALGDLAIRYSGAAVTLGIFASGITLYRILFESGWLHLDFIILYALYIILVPLSLIIPLWSAHKAMIENRSNILLDISRDFEHILLAERNQNIDELKELDKKLSELKVRYTLVMETYPTWPLSIKIFKKFSLTATLPIVISLVSVLIDIFRPWIVSLP